MSFEPLDAALRKASFEVEVDEGFLEPPRCRCGALKIAESSNTGLVYYCPTCDTEDTT